MTEKLSLEQFRIIRSQLDQISRRFDEYENDTMPEDLEQELYDQYLTIQNHLLSFDLSDIPFEEWDGFQVFSTDQIRADFSKTKANIDFGLVHFYGNADFRGCNVRNIQNIHENLDEHDFDSRTIQENADLFLSNSFDDSFKEKYYHNFLSIEDFLELTDEQLKELEDKEYEKHLNYENYGNGLFGYFGLYRTIELYKHSSEEFDAIKQLFKNSYIMGKDFNKLLDVLKNTDIPEIKEVCFNSLRNHILYSRVLIDLSDYSEMFIKENPDIFLIDIDLDENVKDRYYKKTLSTKDLLEYPDIFSNLPIDYFMSFKEHFPRYVRDNYGVGIYIELVKKYPDVFSYLTEQNELYRLEEFFVGNSNIDNDFHEAVRKYFVVYAMPDNFVSESNGLQVVNQPNWLSSMNYTYINKLMNTDDLLLYNPNVFILNEEQRKIIDYLGYENIQRLEKETGFFSHKGRSWSNDLEMLEAFSGFLRMNKEDVFNKNGIDFKNGSLSYEEFLNQFAKTLEFMKQRNLFTDYPDYDWMEGSFRDKYPSIFVDKSAPQEIKDAFYKNKISPAFLFDNKNSIPFLVDKNLNNVIKADIKLAIPALAGENGSVVVGYLNFVDEYSKRYGNEKLLNLIAKYGHALSNITILNLDGEIESEERIESAVKDAIYKLILKGSLKYDYLENVDDFVNDHPELFVDFNQLDGVSEEERKKIRTNFYSHKFLFSDIRKNPQLVELLKDKKIDFIFVNKGTFNSSNNTSNKDLMLLEAYGNEEFLKLCATYGRYMDDAGIYLDGFIELRDGNLYHLDDNKPITIEEISKLIEEYIYMECELGDTPYYESDAPDFLKKEHPELFLNEDAPQELKDYFYNSATNYRMSFKQLQSHREWLPYLEGKAIKTSLIRGSNEKAELLTFFELFGDDKAIKLGINRAETVNEMVNAHQVRLMKKWYDKTGGRFIPDCVVMQNFDINEADKFLTSGSNWSQLMKINNFASKIESRDAMLKVAYSFGAFDNDQRGFKKVVELLSDLPKKVDAQQGYIFENIDNQIDMYSQRGYFFKNTAVIHADGSREIVPADLTPEEKEEAYQKMMREARGANFLDLFDNKVLVNLLETLKAENVNIDYSYPIMSQLYKKNEDGSYSLTINAQNYPKTTQAIRGILERFRDLPIITPDKAHQLFGAFELKYDPDFREFFIKNMETIIKDPESIRLLAAVQRQFNEIKTINSNRVLTWDLAVSFVKTNKYSNINPGNERVAEIASIANYSQADFITLQQIYNYGKQRVFSSIPRIEKTSGKYNYEILRLDDPLAMAVGTLTDCCQEINDCAEMCMEHSMVDKNGRVFVIKDDEGNIVAQSWVWRNKDVLCFDNIEIPEKAFVRAERGDNSSRKEFTEEVYRLYREAAHELIEADEKIYKELLESGRITQEQFDGLRLGKITVGSGYNDIADALKRNAKLDKGIISRPLEFRPPVKLSRGLYTNDSTSQYILEERDNRIEYEGNTLTPHNDDYIEYSDDNFKKKYLLTLEKLEIITKNNPRFLETDVGEDVEEDKFVTTLAKGYGLNPKTTRVVMNPNFAIIFDRNDNTLKVGDLLFNTVVDNEQQKMDIEHQVVMQIALAFAQIGKGLEIDVSDLDEKQKEMYLKATQLTDELDIERGVMNAK